MTLVRPLMINLEMTVRDDCAVLAPPPTLSIKTLTSCLWGGDGSGPLDRCPPPSPSAIASI